MSVEDLCSNDKQMKNKPVKIRKHMYFMECFKLKVVTFTIKNFVPFSLRFEGTHSLEKLYLFSNYFPLCVY